LHEELVVPACDEELGDRLVVADRRVADDVVQDNEEARLLLALLLREPRVVEDALLAREDCQEDLGVELGEDQRALMSLIGSYG
jgi:hypothetical protein